MGCSSANPQSRRFPFWWAVRYSTRNIPLSTISWLVPFPPPTISSFPLRTGLTESSWSNGAKRSPRCCDLVQSGTFEVLHRSCCMSLSENSFEDAKTFFQLTENGDIRFDFSVVDRRMRAQDEQDSTERRRSFDIIIIIVRPLPFALITHLTRTLTRRLRFPQLVPPSCFRSTDS